MWWFMVIYMGNFILVAMGMRGIVKILINYFERRLFLRSNEKSPLLKVGLSEAR